MALNLREISFQDPLRSKPVRLNFQDIESETALLQAQIDAISTAASGNETVLARQQADTLLDRLVETAKPLGNYVLEGFEVNPQAVPDLSVKVKAGKAIINGNYVSRGYATWTRSGTTITLTEVAHDFTASTSVIYIDVTSASTPLPLGEETIVTTPTADTFTVTGVASGATSGTCEYSRYTGNVSSLPGGSDKRFDIVYVDSDGAISIDDSPANDDPEPIYPIQSIGRRALAYFTLLPATASIAAVFDMREYGCMVYNEYYFDLQSAYDNASGHQIHVNTGRYFGLEVEENGDIYCEPGTEIAAIGTASSAIYRASTDVVSSVRIEGVTFGPYTGASANTTVVSLKDITNLTLDKCRISHPAAGSASPADMELDDIGNGHIEITNILPECTYEDTDLTDYSITTIYKGVSSNLSKTSDVSDDNFSVSDTTGLTTVPFIILDDTRTPAASSGAETLAEYRFKKFITAKIFVGWTSGISVDIVINVNGVLFESQAGDGSPDTLLTAFYDFKPNDLLEIATDGVGCSLTDVQVRSVVSPETLLQIT